MTTLNERIRRVLELDDMGNIPSIGLKSTCEAATGRVLLRELFDAGEVMLIIRELVSRVEGLVQELQRVAINCEDDTAFDSLSIAADKAIAQYGLEEGKDGK